jgi:capsular polysaccharide biosynthesis protein
MAMSTPLQTTLASPEEATAEQARLTGRQLAEHPLLASRAGERPGVAAVLEDARPLLSTYGVSFEILRTRPDMVVLRAKSDGRVSAAVACELVKGLLAVVPEQVCAVKASVVENTCAQRGAPACLYSMVWEGLAAPSSVPAPPSPETLLDPPMSDPVLQSVPAVDAPLPAWDRVVQTEPPVMPGQGAPTFQHPIEAVPAPVPNPPRFAESVPPTAATSTSYQFQVSTPNAIVVPTLTHPIPVPVASTPVAPQAVESVLPPGLVARRRRFPKGLIRRGWLLALALIAGSAGGWFAGVHAGTTYSADATLVVQSGAGATGPGSANDALALATTYSALIPKDHSILSAAASTLHISTSAVEHSLSVTVESGTSILLVDFSAPTAARAVAGADSIARAVGSSTQLTAAIPAGSVAIVNVPDTAQRQGTLHKYGIALGAFLGLVLGLILVLAAERADPRIDDAVAMAAATGCRAALVPDDLSFAELARVLSDAGTGTGLTVVPIAVSDTSPTMELARGLRPCWPANGPAVAISPSFSSGVVELTRGTGPTVLVTHAGARQRDIVVAAERLRMIGRPPVWAVLASRRLRSRVSGRVG